MSEIKRDKEREPVLLSGARTPTGRLLGGLSKKSVTELGAIAIEAAVDRAGIDPETVYEVFMGIVVQAGAGQAPARRAALGGGLPDNVGAAAINKVCGSGLKAVMLAANGIAAGEGKVYVAGGMESMSNAPFLALEARKGYKFGHGEFTDSLLHDGLWCGFEEWVMGNAAEYIAKQFEVTREEMDEFALRSHERAAAATAGGRFRAEITPVTIKGRKGREDVVDQDESIRAAFDNGSYTLQTSMEALGKLPPAFEPEGSVTAGNAPGLNDGSAALVVTSRAEAERQGVKPVARIVGYTHAAVPPKWIFAAPARAIPRLLERVDWTLEEVDLIELNEAFAAQALANGVELAQKGYNWDWDKVNVNGGAIALGHPVGCSGARILVTLIHALQQRDLKRGVAALCLGGGEAVALAVELEA
ncbi:MAG: acetyl-CoA C-acetyltransferase [Candidatus Promineifilaceae bacterium]|nr:acetyl-CoA C-acetyltransferase [Candidatus Promineifilaceae bacterium]